MLQQYLSYRTPKFVIIRDWKLGLMSYSLMVCIMLKIVILGIMKNNIHLRLEPIYGSARANVQEPTNGCNPLENGCEAVFDPMSKLPYCKQHSGDGNATGSPGVVRNCKYWDGIQMQLGRTPVPGTFFVPTRYTRLKQKRGCEPSEDNDWKCSTSPWVTEESAEQEDFFIANAEKFTMRMSHACETASQKDMASMGNPLRLHGFVEPQPATESAEVMPVVGVTRDRRPVRLPSRPDPNSTLPSAFRLEDGDDIVSLYDLLRLADWDVEDLLDTDRELGSTMRWDGAVVRISIEYQNKQPWDPFGRARPHYTIKALILPMPEYKVMFGEPEEDGDGRVVHNVHGLLFVLSVTGHLRVWDPNTLLQVLTTAMVSLALAQTLTDAIMTNFLIDADKYSILKYQPSQDFSKLRRNIAVLKDHHGAKYDPLTHKPQPHAEYLNNCAEDGELPGGEDLLLVLLKFEQRLNRLDAMDPLNAVMNEGDGATDAGLKWINDREQLYADGLKSKVQHSGKETEKVIRSPSTEARQLSAELKE